MNTETIKQQLTDNLEVLRTLRDEIRLHLHLGSMEAKEAWKQLEPGLFEAEQLARSATEQSRRSIAETVVRFRLFKEALLGRPAPRDDEPRIIGLPH